MDSNTDAIAALCASSATVGLAVAGLALARREQEPNTRPQSSWSNRRTALSRKGHAIAQHAHASVSRLSLILSTNHSDGKDDDAAENGDSNAQAPARSSSKSKFQAWFPRHRSSFSKSNESFASVPGRSPANPPETSIPPVPPLPTEDITSSYNAGHFHTPQVLSPSHQSPRQISPRNTFELISDPGKSPKSSPNLERPTSSTSVPRVGRISLVSSHPFQNLDSDASNSQTPPFPAGASTEHALPIRKPSRISNRFLKKAFKGDNERKAASLPRDSEVDARCSSSEKPRPKLSIFRRSTTRDAVRASKSETESSMNPSVFPPPTLQRPISSHDHSRPVSPGDPPSRHRRSPTEHREWKPFFRRQFEPGVLYKREETSIPSGYNSAFDFYGTGVSEEVPTLVSASTLFATDDVDDRLSPASPSRPRAARPMSTGPSFPFREFAGLKPKGPPQTALRIDTKAKMQPSLPPIFSANANASLFSPSNVASSPKMDGSVSPWSDSYAFGELSDHEHTPVQRTFPEQVARSSDRSESDDTGSVEVHQIDNNEDESDNDADFDENAHKLSLFNWAETEDDDRHSKARMSFADSLCLHPEDTDTRNGRQIKRKNSSQLRSQSVPCRNSREVTVQEKFNNNDDTIKFATWGLGSKGVSEDWDNDFEFELECSDEDTQLHFPQDEVNHPDEYEEDFELPPNSAVPGDKSMKSATTTVKIPEAIMEQQARVYGQFGQVQEFTLLVEELKRLVARGNSLRLTHPATSTDDLWKEAKGIINLANLEGEMEDDDKSGLEILAKNVTVSAAYTPSFQAASPATAATSTRPPSPALSYDSVEAAFAKVSSPSMDTQLTSAQSTFNTRSEIFKQRPPSHMTLDSLSSLRLLSANIKDENAHNARMSSLNNLPQSHSRSRSSTQPRRQERLPFDTQSLKTLVTRAGVVTRSLKDVLRNAEGVAVPSSDSSTDGMHAHNVNKHARTQSRPHISLVFPEMNGMFSNINSDSFCSNATSSSTRS